jgi:hypothetical protein
MPLWFQDRFGYFVLRVISTASKRLAGVKVKKLFLHTASTIAAAIGQNP